MMPEPPRHPTRADKIAIGVTVIMLVVCLVVIIVNACIHTETVTLKMLHEHYPSSEIYRTDASVYLVRRHDGTVLQVHEGGLFRPRILKETVVFNPQQTF